LTDASDGTPPWDIKGMLDHVMEGMQAAHTIAAIEERGGNGEPV
jgi:tRNA (Thr-GGU) A37 N-methylase